MTPLGGRALPGSRRVASNAPDAPIQSFLAVDAFEIRHEILVRLRDVGVLVGTDAGPELGVEDQTEIKERIRRLVLEHTTLEVDGEMQANVALDGDLLRDLYPFCHLKGEANVLIFPNLDAGNIAYKLMERFGGAEVIGPILMGLKRPVTVLQRACSVSSIVHNTTITAVKALGGFERDGRTAILDMMNAED